MEPKAILAIVLCIGILAGAIFLHKRKKNKQ